MHTNRCNDPTLQGRRLSTNNSKKRKKQKANTLSTTQWRREEEQQQTHKPGTSKINLSAPKGFLLQLQQQLLKQALDKMEV